MISGDRGGALESQRASQLVYRGQRRDRPTKMVSTATRPCPVSDAHPRRQVGAEAQASEIILQCLSKPPHLFFLSYLCFLCTTTVFLSVYSAFLLCLCLLIFPYSPNILMASFNLIFIVNCRESVSIRSIFRASAMIGLLVLS